MSKFRRASAAAVAEAEKSQNPALEPPPTARVDRKDPRTKSWTETVKVIGASAEETESKAGHNHIAMTIECEIIEGTGGPTNVGKRVSYRGRFNDDAYQDGAGDKNDGQYKMHRGTLAVLSILYQAAGLYPGGDIEPELHDAVFPDEGESALKDFTIDAYIKQGPNDTGALWPEIRRFLPADSGGSSDGGETL